LHNAKDREDIDQDIFSVYYQIPPAGKQPPAALGIQFTTSILNFTKPEQSEAPAKSTSAKKSIFKVSLPFSFPFHLLTGYIEVNLQHGGALEHPSKCVHFCLVKS
jgi:hypothetical protein